MYARFVGRVLVEVGDGELREEVRARHELGFRERCRVVLKSGLLPWAVLKDREVYFLTPLADELRPVTGDVGGLKGLAELMGWEYKRVRVGNRVLMAAATTFDALVELLKSEVGDQDQQQVDTAGEGS